MSIESINNIQWHIQFYDICEKTVYKIFARISQVIKMASWSSPDGCEKKGVCGEATPSLPYLLGE